MATRTWWTIDVEYYGDFEFFGTEEEAREMRDAKAEWEGGKGQMWPADAAAIAAGIDHIKWRQRNGYPLQENEIEALAQA